ncbi:heparan-alpha-glucosaminide N-acetyltransferase domain-containing protein [Georgenia sp. SYP-B2076]|uniref:heparan-alpha-glucosaminide N-acetyltransferase domain-containing protein n=1 Tax=Georgenia sp. SYP-B2076 TaxID=2495881 RepID=UPI000F8F7036|nr:heparan-alpha-glucosaminide N-acetyltransferase domain-containing protein [Georgenia sp. SYP-B2076]
MRRQAPPLSANAGGPPLRVTPIEESTTSTRAATPAAPQVVAGPGPGPVTTTRPAAAAAAEVTIPHDCEPATLAAKRGAGAAKPGRLTGIDIARCVAVFAMMSVHILPAVGPNGAMSLPFVLAAGKSAALFAVVAGVGVAFSSGREKRPRGRRWVAAAASMVVRAVLIATIGLLLGEVVPFDTAAVILAYYGILFVLAIPLLSLSVRSLAVLGLVSAVVIPVLSHLVRPELGTPALINPTFGELADPGALLSQLSLTGIYPAVPWVAYICAGMAVGRSRLASRGVVLRITVIGVVLAVAASATSWLLLNPLGGWKHLEAVALPNMTLVEYTDLVVWGADGTVPTTSPWWLALLTPHSTTPLDLLYTTGIALTVVGVALLLGRVAGRVLAPLAAAGSMPLTLYSFHLLMLASPFMPASPTATFVLQAVVLVTFANLWSRRCKRGPLEHALSFVTDHVRTLIMGARRTPTPDHRTPDHPLAPAGAR